MGNILDLIGNTPLVDLSGLLGRPGIKLFGKLEGRNPGGSVKDRAAYSMIQGAMERGEIDKETRLIEPTSGNTGISLAMIAAIYNLDIELVMPENATAERVKTMQAFGSSVTLTKAEWGMEAAIDYAHEKVKEGNYLMLNQFANPDNYRAHFRTTGPEIWRDTHGQVTHFVSAMGTTGTIMGVSRFLKSQNDTIRIIGVQPTEDSHIPGIRRWPETYLPKIFEPERVDLIIDVSEDEAVEMTRRLAKETGVFAGMSSGGAVAAAIKMARNIRKAVIVCIICDGGDRYLSSSIFE